MPKIVVLVILKTWSLRSNSVTRQVIFNRRKIGAKCHNKKIQMRHFEQISNNVGHYDPQFCHSGKVAVIIIFSLLVHLWNFWALILLILLKYPEWQKFCWALDTQWLYRSLWKVFCFCWGLLAPAAANLMWVKKGPIFTHGDDVTIISYTQGATKKGFQCSCQINGVSCRLCPVSTLGLQLPLNNEIPTNHQLPPLLSRFCEDLCSRAGQRQIKLTNVKHFSCRAP